MAFNTNSPNTRKDSYRIGKTKTNSNIMRSVARYLQENGPSPVVSIWSGATLVNGKKMRNSRTSPSKGTLINVLKMRGDDFYKVDTVKIKGARQDVKYKTARWMVREDSSLLQEPNYQAQRGKAQGLYSHGK